MPRPAPMPRPRHCPRRVLLPRLDRRAGRTADPASRRSGPGASPRAPAEPRSTARRRPSAVPGAARPIRPIVVPGTLLGPARRDVGVAVDPATTTHGRSARGRPRRSSRHPGHHDSERRHHPVDGHPGRPAGCRAVARRSGTRGSPAHPRRRHRAARGWRRGPDPSRSGCPRRSRTRRNAGARRDGQVLFFLVLVQLERPGDDLPRRSDRSGHGLALGPAAATATATATTPAPAALAVGLRLARRPPGPRGSPRPRCRARTRRSAATGTATGSAARPRRRSPPSTASPRAGPRGRREAPPARSGRRRHDLGAAGSAGRPAASGRRGRAAATGSGSPTRVVRVRPPRVPRPRPMPVPSVCLSGTSVIDRSLVVVRDPPARCVTSPSRPWRSG